LRLTASRPVCHGVGPPDQIFITLRHLQSSCCGTRLLTRGLVCNLLVQFAVTLVSKSRRTHDHILLCHMRPLSEGPGPCIYIPQEQGGQFILQGIGFPFCRLLRLAGLRWRYSNLPPHGSDWLKFKLHCDWRSVGQFVLVPGPLWGTWPDFNFLYLTITFFFM
jgi:hypothetical protein